MDVEGEGNINKTNYNTMFMSYKPIDTKMSNAIMYYMIHITYILCVGQTHNVITLEVPT